LSWAKKFDKVIKGEATDPETVEKYGRIVWASPLHANDDERKKVLNSLKEKF